MSMRDGPAHCALTTLQTLPSMVVDLRLFNDVLVAATQCQGAVVWRQVSGLIADAPIPVSLFEDSFLARNYMRRLPRHCTIARYRDRQLA